MNRRIIFFTPGDAMYGFNLAGFEQQVCGAQELEHLLEEYVKKDEFGLFVIDERLMTESLEDRVRDMERGHNIVFVIMPPPERMEVKREDYAVRLLRKAIGYHVRLNV